MDVRMDFLPFEAVRISPGAHQLSAILSDQDHLMPGHVFVPVSDGIGRIRTLQKEGVSIFLQGDGQDDVVALPERGIVRTEITPVGIEYRVLRLDSASLKQAKHVIGQGLAVAESGLVHGSGGEGLESADAELDAHIAGLILEITIQDADFLQVRRGTGRQVPYLAHGLGRQGFFLVQELVLPRSHILPGVLTAGDAVENEGVGGGQDDGYQFRPGGHVHFRDITLVVLDLPLVALILVAF